VSLREILVEITRHTALRLRERFFRRATNERALVDALNSYMKRALLAPYLNKPGRYQLWYPGFDLLFLLEPIGDGQYRALTFMHVLRAPSEGEEVLVSYRWASRLPSRQAL
jgi:hypothetical protein